MDWGSIGTYGGSILGDSQLLLTKHSETLHAA